MKKFIKWFLFWLVVCGGLALAICYMVIPQQTNSAIDIVIGYLNTPLGIVGGSTITLGMVVYIVVSNLLKLNRDKAKQDFEECKQELEEKKKELDNKVKELECKLDKKDEQIDKILQMYFTFKYHCVDTISQIPNKKVQESLQDLLLVCEQEEKVWIERLEQLYGKDQERTND